ncbi:MAG: S8 family serine peptidase [Phycisphaerae bacterium]|nr:S8 family serine peptidase [Phycisphaerae bacterium]
MPRRPVVPRCLWSVSLNRPATCQLKRSVAAAKADASRRLFDVDGAGICWAVIDSGVDARNAAFRRRKGREDGQLPYPAAFEETNRVCVNRTRVVATYDFTRFRKVTSDIQLLAAADGMRKSSKCAKQLSLADESSDDLGRPLTPKQIADIQREIGRALTEGRILDWSKLGPLLRVPHGAAYRFPEHPHGTHVAGILGADWRTTDPTSRGKVEMIGMCPGISLYDLRVMGNDGRGDEFSILAALQFVRWLNAQRDQLAIHGVNLSLSMLDDVRNFASGRTPVCEECERLVAEGVVVVAAAGNYGRANYEMTDGGSEEGYRTVSITDPGNAESVITVGATHRSEPHTYGVSYFSSRGPTGDGRLKPDLLAPGEKIRSVVPEDKTEMMDGTSMAAPHVSGAAALLLCTHRELIGKPQRVKRVLCDTATDLGRERYFQGHGMLDTLRALQSL